MEARLGPSGTARLTPALSARPQRARTTAAAREDANPATMVSRLHVCVPGHAHWQGSSNIISRAKPAWGEKTDLESFHGAQSRAALVLAAHCKWCGCGAYSRGHACSGTRSGVMPPCRRRLWNLHSRRPLPQRPQQAMPLRRPLPGEPAQEGACCSGRPLTCTLCPACCPASHGLIG